MLAGIELRDAVKMLAKLSKICACTSFVKISLLESVTICCELVLVLFGKFRLLQGSLKALSDLAHDPVLSLDQVRLGSSGDMISLINRAACQLTRSLTFLDHRKD